MAQRRTATEKWSDVWYYGLSTKTKLCLEFIQGNCDCAGIWEPNFEEAEFKIGFTREKVELDWNDVFEEMNRPPRVKFEPKLEQADLIEKPKVRVPHVVVLANDRWWLPRFIPFQYGSPGMHFMLRADLPLHIPIFKSLKANECWEKYLSYWPDSVTDAVRKNPPSELVTDRMLTAPKLDEVRGWMEGRDLPDDQIKLFWYHYNSFGWKVKGSKITDPHSKLAVWADNYKKGKDDTWKNETPGQLRIRIEEIDKRLLALGKPPHVWTPPGKDHQELTPEAMRETKDLKARRALFEAKIRGETTHAGKPTGNK
jgi:hypothetical protein